jgi:hypothetical protein
VVAFRQVDGEPIMRTVRGDRHLGPGWARPAFGVIAAIVGALGGLAAIGAHISETIDLSAVHVLIAAFAACALALAAFFALSLADRLLRSRAEGRKIDSALARIQERLGQADRLGRAEEIFTEDPDGVTIDPESEPELFRLYLLKSNRITADQFAMYSERDAVIERVVEEAEMARKLMAGLGPVAGAGSEKRLQLRLEEINRSLAEAAAHTRSAA